MDGGAPFFSVPRPGSSCVHQRRKTTASASTPAAAAAAGRRPTAAPVLSVEPSPGNAGALVGACGMPLPNVDVGADVTEPVAEPEVVLDEVVAFGAADCVEQNTSAHRESFAYCASLRF